MTNYAELRAIAEAATPGPWHRAANVFHGGTPTYPSMGASPLVGLAYLDNPRWLNDATYIATFNPQFVLGLLDRAADADRYEAATAELRRGDGTYYLDPSTAYEEWVAGQAQVRLEPHGGQR